MKKGSWNSNEEDIWKKRHELLDATLDINGVSPRIKKVSGKLPSAFFGFSGHTTGVCVRIYKEGWEPDDRPSFDKSVYSDKGENNLNDLICEIKEYAAKEGLLK